MEDDYVHIELTRPKSALVIIVSYLFLFLGVLGMTYGNEFIGFIFAAGAVLNLSFKKGIYLDLKNRKFIQYETYFTVRTGKWKDLNLYSELILLTKKKSSSIYGQSGASISEKFITYDSFLVDKTHRNKVMLDSTKEKQEAIERIDHFSRILGYPIVPYNPVISEATRKRR